MAALKLFTRQGVECRVQDGTAGSVIFLDSSGSPTEDNAGLNYNDTTNILSAIMNVGQTVEPHGFSNVQYSSVTAGTDTACATNTQFVTSVFLPCNKTITGVAYLVGSVGGTDKVYAALYDASGALCGNSTVGSGGVTVGTAAQVQTLALTSTYAAKGPAMFYVGISVNGATAKVRTVPVYQDFGIYGNTVSQAHGTVAAIAAPSTFTANKAPYVFVY